MHVDIFFTVCYLLRLWADIQRQNEQRCEQEIEDVKRQVKSVNITANNSLARFSDEALDEQKHSIRIADEKVVLAIQAYDLVCVLHPRSLLVFSYVNKPLGRDLRNYARIWRTISSRKN